MATTSDMAPQSTPRRSGSLLVSITCVCFVFGMVLAMQLRAQQNLLVRRTNGQNLSQVTQMQIQSLTNRVGKAEKERDTLQAKVNDLQSSLARVASGSKAEAKKLQAQMQELQLVAGQTPVTGPGIVVRMTDNPKAAQNGDGSPFLPGIVHDFDLLQVVNELRSAKAEAIAIQGADAAPIRVTGFTPIRCVGPVIYVSGEVVAAPFKVYAIGNPDALASALKMPDGIVDKLSQLFPVKVTENSELKLPAVESAPKMRVAKVAKSD